MGLVLGIVLFGVVIAAIVVVAGAHRRRQSDVDRRAAFIAAYRFPPELERRLAARLPQLDAQQRRLVLEGLRQYFLVVLASRRGRISRYLGMPSRAVDEAWHEFIVMTKDYEAFCREAFGEFLHHRPGRQMEESSRDALANTLHQLKRDPPNGAAWAMLGGVPLLFALDRQLALAGGHTHNAADIAELELRRSTLAASGDSGGTTSWSSSGSGDPDPHGHGDGGGYDSGGGGGGGGGGGSCGGGGGGCGSG